ncbi:unnamed protein product [Closterium sp. Naga37s-1]|nr:unnamed protein product [Closterium sp. Naga37s-1]
MPRRSEELQQVIKEVTSQLGEDEERGDRVARSADSDEEATGGGREEGNDRGSAEANAEMNAERDDEEAPSRARESAEGGGESAEGAERAEGGELAGDAEEKREKRGEEEEEKAEVGEEKRENVVPPADDDEVAERKAEKADAAEDDAGEGEGGEKADRRRKERSEDGDEGEGETEGNGEGDGEGRRVKKETQEIPEADDGPRAEKEEDDAEGGDDDVSKRTRGKGRERGEEEADAGGAGGGAAGAAGMEEEMEGAAVTPGQDEMIPGSGASDRTSTASGAGAVGGSEGGSEPITGAGVGGDVFGRAGEGSAGAGLGSMGAGEGNMGAGEGGNIVVRDEGSMGAVVSEEELEILKHLQEDVAVRMSEEEQMELEAGAVADADAHSSYMQEVMGIRRNFKPTLMGMKDKASKHVLPHISQIARTSRPVPVCDAPCNPPFLPFSPTPLPLLSHPFPTPPKLPRQGLSLCVTIRSSERGQGKFIRLRAVLQLLVSLGVGLHAYITIFERAMLDLPPNASAGAYAAYAACFFFLVLISRGPKRHEDKDK